MDNIAHRSSVLAEIQDVVRRELNDPELVIAEHTTAEAVPGWDSLAHVQIIFGVEKLFRVKLKSFEVGALENIGSLVDIVLARGGRGAG